MHPPTDSLFCLTALSCFKTQLLGVGCGNVHEGMQADALHTKLSEKAAAMAGLQLPTLATVLARFQAQHD